MSESADYLQAQVELLAGIDPASVDRLADLIHAAWREDRAVLVCGNGGSASIASHIACDLTKQTLIPGRRALRAISLADNMAIVTAWANDAGFSRVFAEQVGVHGRRGDLLLVLSCSGDSDNVVEAITTAHEAGMKVVAVVGFEGGAAAAAADLTVHVPSRDYGAIESAFLVVEHCVARILRDRAAHEAEAVPVAGAVFVDRDGVINRNLPGGVRHWEDFEFLPGALEGIARLSQGGYRVIVVTNQANVGRGLLTRAQLDELHRRMQQEVLLAGGAIAAVYACEHLPEAGCDCRKPAPGLLIRAAEEHGIDLPGTYFIGDHESDVAAALAAGATPLLVRSGRGGKHAAPTGTPAFDDLRAAAEMVVSGTREEEPVADVSAVSR